MNTIPNPDNWMDVATIVIVALIAAIPSWLAARNHGAIKAVAAQNEEIRGQVVNGHAEAPPLRADIDRLLAAVDSLREATEDERKMRREQIRELREDVDARLTALHKRLSD